jgi:hypothetical protein
MHLPPPRSESSPVLLRGEFGCKSLNSLTDWTEEPPKAGKSAKFPVIFPVSRKLTAETLRRTHHRLQVLIVCKSCRATADGIARSALALRDQTLHLDPITSEAASIHSQTSARMTLLPSSRRDIARSPAAPPSPNLHSVDSRLAVSCNKVSATPLDGARFGLAVCAGRRRNLVIVRRMTNGLY